MGIEQQLLTLGFSEKEALVYLDLAETGKSTAHLLSKRTGIPRTTAYWALDNLVARGLASIEQKKHTTYYAANQPDALLRMVQVEKRKLADEAAQKHAVVTDLIRAITPMFRSKGIQAPKLQSFEGKEGVRSMLYDYGSVWQGSAFQYDRTWWGFQDHTFAEGYVDWLEHSWKLKRKDEVYKIVTNQSDIERKLSKAAPHRKMKFIPPEYQFSSTMWVVGDYIVQIMTHQKPHYAFQLRDPLFAQNMRLIFQILWEKAL
jgi:predicted transcriptional regulator